MSPLSAYTINFRLLIILFSIVKESSGGATYMGCYRGTPPGYVHHTVDLSNQGSFRGWTYTDGGRLDTCLGACATHGGSQYAALVSFTRTSTQTIWECDTTCTNREVTMVTRMLECRCIQTWTGDQGSKGEDCPYRPEGVESVFVYFGDFEARFALLQVENQNKFTTNGHAETTRTTLTRENNTPDVEFTTKSSDLSISTYQSTEADGIGTKESTDDRHTPSDKSTNDFSEQSSTTANGYLTQNSSSIGFTTMGATFKLDTQTNSISLSTIVKHPRKNGINVSTSVVSTETVLSVSLAAFLIIGLLIFIFWTIKRRKHSVDKSVNSTGNGPSQKSTSDSSTSNWKLSPNPEKVLGIVRPYIHPPNMAASPDVWTDIDRYAASESRREMAAKHEHVIHGDPTDTELSDICIEITNEGDTDNTFSLPSPYGNGNKTVKQFVELEIEYEECSTNL